MAVALASTPVLITDGAHDGLLLRTVWDGTSTLGSMTPTLSCSSRGISGAVTKYKTGSGTTTFDWWIQDANNRIRAGDTGVSASFPADCVKIGATGNDAALGVATTNSSLAAAYAPTYGRTSNFKLYADIRGNGANTVYAGPVQSIVEFGPSEVDTLAHFQTAAATKLPVGSKLALLNFENLYPASGNYADFDTDSAWATNLPIIASILAWARATYTDHVFVPYPGPNVYSSIAVAGQETARANRLLYASRSYSLVEVIGYANGMCPEFFDRDTSMNQAAMDAYAVYTMDIARAVNSLAYPRMVRPMYPVMYLNNPDSPYTDFSASRIAVSITALMRAGADGVIYAASESLKNAAAWQVDADFRQRQAFAYANLIGSDAQRRSRARGRA